MVYNSSYKNARLMVLVKHCLSMTMVDWLLIFGTPNKLNVIVLYHISMTSAIAYSVPFKIVDVFILSYTL